MPAINILEFYNVMRINILECIYVVLSTFLIIVAYIFRNVKKSSSFNCKADSTYLHLLCFLFYPKKYTDMLFRLSAYCYPGALHPYNSKYLCIQT